MLHVVKSTDCTATVLANESQIELKSDHLLSFSNDLKFEKSKDRGFVCVKPKNPAELILAGNQLQLIQLESVSDTLHFRKDLTVAYSYLSRLKNSQSKEMFSFKKPKDSVKDFVILNLNNELFIEDLCEHQSIIVPKLNLVGGTYSKTETRMNQQLQVFGPGKVYLSSKPPTQRFLPPPIFQSTLTMFLFLWLIF